MEKWSKVAKHSSCGISCTAFRSQGASIAGNFQLGIFFSTFESRGLVSSTLLQRDSCEHAVIVSFREAQETRLRRANDAVLQKQVRRCSSHEPVIISGVSVNDAAKIADQMLSSLPAACLAREAQWFIDLAGAPSPHFLLLLAHLRDAFPCPRLTMFNPTGDYGKERTRKYTFTSGFDSNMWVPRLWGHPDPTLPSTYVFLLGFEGYRSYEVFYRCEPDRMMALVAKPGYKKGYEKQTLERNRLFLRESGLWPSDSSIPDVLPANAADPTETWRILEKIAADEKGKSNLVFVPLGPKALTLGCGLCALSDGAPAVLYHMPRSYDVRDVKRGKYLWKYEITL